MRTRRALVGVGAAGAVLALAACGGPRYQYVQNDSLGVYAKMPAKWAIYDERDLFPDASKTDRASQAQGSWIRTFDGSSKPSVSKSTEMGSSAPTGSVQVQAIGRAGREQINISGLRGLVALNDPQSDPMTLAQQNPDVSVLKDEPVTFKGGFHGVHTVLTVPNKAHTGTVVIDATGLLDSTDSVFYGFRVSCSSRCYFETHKDEIAKVVDSWTIQEVR